MRVEKLIGSTWTTVLTDMDWETTYRYKKTGKH
jgi:hypothetical protein